MSEIAAFIKKTFDPYYEAPLSLWEHFADAGEVVHASKNEILKHSGHTERYFYFMLQGSGGVLLLHDHQYKCLDLCFSGDFFGDYLSFLTAQPTPLETMVFEASALFRIAKARFDALAATPEGQVLCHKASDSLFIHKQTQQVELLTMTAEQRYLQLLHHQPGIVAATPSKYLASYLGITPESMSRIKRKVM
jgi:CRP-like cAMP-binding protein